MNSDRRRRLFPSWWYSLILALPLLTIVWLRAGDVTGDRGLTNVMSAMLVFLFLLLAGSWFLLLSGYSARVRILTLAAAAVAVLLFGILFRYEGVDGSMRPTYRFRFAAADGLPALPDGPAGADLATTTPDDFPGFLGPRRDAAVDHVALEDWSGSPPRELWRRPVGAGWSGFAVVNGVAVTMEQRGDEEAVTAYDARTGELLWAQAHAGRFDHFLGGPGPRSTPSVDEGLVYALGASGWLVCLDGGTGDIVWERDLLADYGVSPEVEAREIQYGRSNSPLVDGNLVIVPAGGDPATRVVSLAAFDKKTGERVWEAGDTQISFSSPGRAVLAGVEQILIVNEDTLSGHDPDTGARLWEHPWPGDTASTASSSQAVPVPPDRVFVSKGYGGGAALLRLIPGEDGAIDVEPVWASHRVLRTKFTNVVIRDGYVYGLSDGILECVDLDTGRRMWKSGRYDHGQILRVGGRLLVLSEDGELALVELTPEEHREMASIKALEGKTWNNLALYGDLLLVRNGQEAAAYRLPVVRRTARPQPDAPAPAPARGASPGGPSGRLPEISVPSAS